jgi:hypothetical protein
MVETHKSMNNDNIINKIVLSKEGLKTFIKKELYKFVSPGTVKFFQDLKFQPTSYISTRIVEKKEKTIKKKFIF